MSPTLPVIYISIKRIYGLFDRIRERIHCTYDIITCRGIAIEFLLNISNIDLYDESLDAKE